MPELVFNAEWPLWITASVMQHFKAAADANSITLFFEGQDRDTADLSEYVELRLQGPHVTEQSLSCFKLEVEVSILVSVKKGGGNIYRPHAIAGLFQAAAIEVCVWDYGNGDNDPYTHQFDLRLIDGPKGKVQWHFLGQVEGNVNLLQGIIVAKYDVELTRS